MSKILIVDDEPNLVTGLKDNLEFEGYETETASNGEEALEKIKSCVFDLIILDIMMPKISGLDVCKKIRQLEINTPVIFLSAKGEEFDKVLGLELGADDYITKPFNLRELLARVKAILRRTENVSAKTKTILIGKLLIDFSTYTASVDGVQVAMSVKEIELLKYLFEHRNKTVSRDDLLKNVWSDLYVTSRTIDNFIVKLRQKIEPNSDTPRFILTVHGMGYKLVM